VTDFYPADFNLTAALTHEPLMPLEKAFGQNHASEKKSRFPLSGCKQLQNITNVR